MDNNAITTDALIIGAGPAGLMAAEVLVAAGHATLIVEAKPSVGRKFLMAGKSGLNLTKDEPFDTFLQSFDRPAELEPMLRAFGPAQVVDWAQGLGQDVFTGSTGRVFPKAMKASPLLRAQLARLQAGGAQLRTRWRWLGGAGDVMQFETPDGVTTVAAKVTVMALGGASWERLGSNGQWAPVLAEKGIDITPFVPANMGLEVAWSDHMVRHFGAPVKAVALQCGAAVHRGEFVVSQRGVEGGGIYALSRALRGGAPLFVDLLPDRSIAQIAGRLARARGKATVANHLRKALNLSPVKQALLMEFARPLSEGEALARVIKRLPLRHNGPRPLDEAISVAGGLPWPALDNGLMLRNWSGVFAAGEMLDWEAPTGGYLLTACMATGRWAGQAAVRYLT
ncbi:NAD(FAD)-utilizing dehydrogenase [Actibacterium mucosum KCTC 23349]|uniref:NAD(FAD)-utilizing dehydrogenase n=1 Tax=Actibacterium mucosum KCTC 23349 TaxID=1454373 RepID=A0A037ZPK8_9RHOB|nr:TIGR03862 family flavoprotein [Actibacterium mucosum]KAJ57458.1 NAD(FAD)-utilizing dehydrogenase [Actibacterium mucosum KCTC 23349]